MIIDASALVAILLNEPEADKMLDHLDTYEAEIFIFPVSIYEAVTALVRVLGCSVTDARIAVNDALNNYNIGKTEISLDVGEEAITAFDRFGKGRHPAGLNMGDCFSYALAKSRRAPLLFKGNDFVQTDIDVALPNNL